MSGDMAGDIMRLTGPPCAYCGGRHRYTACPRIQAIEYHPSGLPSRVEFYPSAPVRSNKETQ